MHLAGFNKTGRDYDEETDRTLRAVNRAPGNRKEAGVDKGDDRNSCGPLKSQSLQISLCMILLVDEGGHRERIGKEYDDA